METGADDARGASFNLDANKVEMTRDRTLQPKMVQVRGGKRFGVNQNRLIFVFTDEQALRNFINQGWEFGCHLKLSAMAGGQGGMFSGAAAVSPGVYLYQVTQTGLAATLTVGGTKFFKDGDLN
jgi:lipid-binding SYLF domain-containing protein